MCCIVLGPLTYFMISKKCHATLPACCLPLQIQELQKEYGKNTEGSEATKPLAHILLEAKQAKDEAFQNQWKQMKQGIVIRHSMWAESAETLPQNIRMFGIEFPERLVSRPDVLRAHADYAQARIGHWTRKRYSLWTH